MRIPQVIVLWAAALSIPGSLLAQSIQSSILGAITDASSAAMAGAKVTLRNQGTNIEQSMAASPDGDYRFSGLLPGMYQVTVSAAGFRTAMQKDIDLNTSQAKRVDIQLEVGDTTSSVTVGATASALETETVTLSNLKTGRDFVQLPLSPFGRGWANVTTVVAGVQSKSGFEVNGARDTANNFTSDGISVNDIVSSRNTANGFSGEVEVLQEVKVQTTNNSAEFPQVAQFNAVTKSGTNQLHGSLYWGNFNSKFSARRWQDRTGPSFTNHNMFAITNGGPVYIPGIYNGKDKTFYFVSYGGARYRVGARQIISVPTAAFRQGDFSSIIGQVRVLDPLTGQQFLNNQIPANRINSTAKAIQDLLYPSPNQPGAGALGVVDNYYADPGGRFDSDVYSFRVDHKLTASNTIFTRVGYTQNNKDHYPGPLLGGYGQNNYTGNIPGRTVAISDTHAFSPTLVNEAKVGFSRTFSYTYDTNYGQDLLSKLAINGISNPGNDPAIGGMPSFRFTGAVGFQGTDTFANGNSQAQNTWQVTDNLSWFRGRHTYKLGGDVRRYQVNDQVKPQSLRGAYSFDDLLSGFAYANFLLGYPSSARRSIARPNAYPRSTQYGIYFQDDFKINQRMTLNYGVRYEHQTPWVDKYDRMFTFLPSIGKIVTAGASIPTDLVPAVVASLPPIITAKEAGLPQRSLMKSDANNFSPRIGLAIRPFKNTSTVVRFGYGVYTQMWPGLLALRLTGGPWQSDQDFTLQSNTVPSIQFPNPFLTTSKFSGLQSVSGINPAFPNERTQQWTASVGRELLGTAIDVGYVGTKVTNIPYSEDWNLLRPSTVPYDVSRRPYPQFTGVTVTQTGGQSIYHGLTVQADRRMARGLSFNVNYTFAKALTDVDLRTYSASAQQNQYQRNLERADDPNIRRQQLRFSYIYELPFGKGKPVFSSAGRVTNNIIGGWQIAGITSFYSGPRLSPTFSGSDPTGTGQSTGRPDRLAGGQFDYNRDTMRARQPIFDVNAFVRPQTARGFYGNSGRYILTGPGEQTWNIAAAKNFYLGAERARLQFRAEAFNALNHANFNAPNMNINSGAFGIVTGAAAARTMLFGLRLDY
jgi:hypothetical protein